MYVLDFLMPQVILHVCFQFLMTLVILHVCFPFWMTQVIIVSNKLRKHTCMFYDFLMAQVTILPDHHVDVIWGVLARVQLEPIFAC
jgi:hypothetical protein